jgi:membrane associated rhomboid family serine protease
MKPLVTVALVAANLAAFALELVGGVEPTCEAWGFTPAHFTIVGLLTSTYLHAGWGHLAGNMALLAVFGTIVERKLGSTHFANLYFVSGVGACLTHWMVNPSATDTLVGASGSIFGVMTAAAILYPRLLGFVCTYAAIEIGCLLLDTSGTVSAACHVGGFSTGFAAMLVFRAKGLT